MKKTRAIILAAGMGARLREISGGKPKSLLQFGGVSLLHRHIALLNRFGIDAILVVTGYRDQDIDSELQSLAYETRIDTAYNADFAAGSVVSLWTARSFLQSGDDIILMDADVLYHRDILRTLLESTHQNCFLLDREFEAGEEPVKICVRNGVMVEFRKQVDSRLEYDFQGESVGFFRLAGPLAGKVAERCARYVDNGRAAAPYEEVLRDLLLQSPGSFAFEDISGLPWIEIDFPDDVERAQRDILPAIDL